MCGDAMKRLGTGVRAGYEERELPPAGFDEEQIPGGVLIRRRPRPTKLANLGALLGSLLRGASDAAAHGSDFQSGFAAAGQMPQVRGQRRLEARRDHERQLMQRAQFERSMQPRPLGRPFATTRGGKSVLVQQFSDGGIHEVSGYEPAPSRADLPRVPEFLESGPFAGNMLDRTTGKMKAATMDMPLTIPASPGLPSPQEIGLPAGGDVPLLPGLVPEQTIQIPVSVPSILEEQRRAPKAIVRTERDARGATEDVMLDTNPNSPTFGETIARPGVRREPLPKKPKAASARELGKAEAREIEKSAEIALRESGDDVDRALAFVNRNAQIDAAMKAKIRARIRERGRKTRKARPSATERFREMTQPPELPLQPQL